MKTIFFYNCRILKFSNVKRDLRFLPWEEIALPRHVLTYDNDVSENVETADRRAIPSLVLELFLAFEQPQPNAVPDSDHGIWSAPTYLPLLLGQARDPAADDLGSQSHHRGHYSERIFKKIVKDYR